MNILIVDDHDVIRQSLSLTIKAEFVNADCITAGTGAESIDLLKNKQFDLLILDMNLPDMDGITLTEWIMNRYPHQKILIFSMNPTEVYARRLYQLGVMGYLNKQANMTELKKALHIILTENKRYMEEEFKLMLAHEFLNNRPGDPLEQLSKRELSIAQLLAAGKTIAEIASQLNIETSTIRTYKARIFQKLEVNTLHDFLAKSKLYKLI